MGSIISGFGVLEDLLGVPSEADMAAEAARQQAQLDANMREQAVTNAAFQKQQTQDSRVRSIQNSRDLKASQIRKLNAKDSSKKKTEIQANMAGRIAGVAGQRAPSGGLKSATDERRNKTEMGYNKWGSSSQGLSIGLRGAKAGRRPS